MRLSPDQVWQKLNDAHTGIVTTLRSNGDPITLPVWFVVDDHTLVFSSPASAKKITRVRRNPRSSFLVESGRAWQELSAVQMTGTITFVEDPDEQERLDEMLAAKYEKFRGLASMSERTATYYADKIFMRFTPDARVLSWDNSTIVATV
ncbi:PPOX class probable F420-dependent enzyme [Nocardioides ginsengisegetis]|uniref:PPOX class probable F420-dependent enzyme n=1 Tax=Nocardioides ginsengisegetis TaxID=661491 RepID=A0A7W3J248_9ACTN|nr:PPOX class probable F420-dependent enzyme [Nocardioides ginsengisegetis]